MSISYPLAIPAQGFASIRLLARDVVGMGESPFTLSQQTQQHAGQRWEADVRYPPMRDVSIVTQVIVMLLSLKGRTGTFLMPVDPLRTVRGSWTGAPVVNGANAAGSSTLAVKGFGAAGTVRFGDYFQVGTGSASRIHVSLTDVTTNGSGVGTLDIWPNLREPLADNAPIVFVNPKCAWRLASNERSWDIGTAQIYGVAFTAVEAL